MCDSSAKMSHQDTEQSATQYKFSTEQLHTKDEPHNEIMPHVHDTRLMDTGTQRGSEEYLKFKRLNEELVIKEEPGHEEYFIQSEATVENTQLKSAVPSENITMERSHLNSLVAEQKEKQFKCDTCDVVFSRLSNLRVHNVTHTAVDPYNCDTCKMGFWFRSSLIRHIRIHSGVKPYKCKICRKAFVRAYDLKSHVRVHTGEKPFKCNLCKKSFSQRISLKLHKNKH